MVGKMTMKSPRSRVIGVEGNDNAFFWRHEYRVANSAGYAHIINFDNLESVSMKMHGMWHHGAICKGKFNSFVFSNGEGWRIFVPDIIID